MSISQEQYFQQNLLRWHRKHNNRQMPWKGEADVYRIWLSEIILQQTRVAQGWAYYERFIVQYPTVQALARAPIEDVYKLWEGLGYYSRCKNLHTTAQYISNELGGVFPDTYEGLLRLKGVGPYTAAAIASFGYGLPYAVVDGNVYRVLSRFFGDATPTDSTAGKKRFAQLAQQCISTKEPGVYNQAIMDFGATVCTPEQPRCGTCLLMHRCQAFSTGAQQRLPVKEKQVRQKNRWFIYYIIQQRGRFALQQRTASDVWQHLFEFPLQECTEADWKNVQKRVKQQQLFEPPQMPGTFQFVGITRPAVQKLSHQTIHAFAVLLQRKGAVASTYQWLLPEELKQRPFPRILHQLFNPEVQQLFR